MKISYNIGIHIHITNIYLNTSSKMHSLVHIALQNDVLDYKNKVKIL